MIRVLLAGLSPAFGAGLRSLLAKDRQIRIIGEVNKWGSQEDREKEVDVVITTSTSYQDNRTGGDSLQTTLSPSILLISDRGINIDRLSQTTRAWGILPYDASSDELIAAVHSLSQGLITGTKQLLFSSNEENPIQSPLTGREQEVLALLSRGMANKQIAISLGISEHTVKFHVSSIYSKLNVTNRTEAVREGLRGGWITL